MTDPLQTQPILQTRLQEVPWMSVGTARLPGTGPVAAGDWLRLDEAYGAQMALRDRLIAERPDQVHAMQPQALAAAQELLALVLSDLGNRPDFSVDDTCVIRPDATIVPLDTGQPLLTLGRLMQQDFCILQRDGDEHHLTGAILCFPASWTLTEKFARPLTAIHAPVPEYSDDLARRVQRLFNAVRPETPLWRVNLLAYQDFALHQPRSLKDRRSDPGGEAEFVRSERQCISRLPETDAIVFAIHTVVVRKADLPTEMQAEIARHHPETV